MNYVVLVLIYKTFFERNEVTETYKLSPSQDF